MEIQRIKSEGGAYRFALSCATASLMNELRRAVMHKLPILAIEEVFFSKNSSALYDEMLALRLGLIPLGADLGKINAIGDCKCKGEGCDNCQIRFSIKVSGPGMVYAKDLKTKGKGVEIIYPEMPLVLLGERQELELQAVAVLGTGREHAKWSPGLAYYQRYPKITVDTKKADAVKRGAEHCPKGVFDSKGKVINPLSCDLCLSCKDCSGAISVDGEDGKFIFTFEGWGQVEPADALKRACDIIKAELKEAKLK